MSDRSEIWATAGRNELIWALRIALITGAVCTFVVWQITAQFDATDTSRVSWPLAVNGVCAAVLGTAVGSLSAVVWLAWPVISESFRYCTERMTATLLLALLLPFSHMGGFPIAMICAAWNRMLYPDLAGYTGVLSAGLMALAVSYVAVNLSFTLVFSKRARAAALALTWVASYAAVLLRFGAESGVTLP